MPSRNPSNQSDLRPFRAAFPGAGVQREEEVCKYIDVTTCIGCKACEVACVEWNDMPFQQTTFDNTYQTMPATAWNYWNLIKFNEHQRDDGTLQWLMRKDQCMHCEDPGCLRACPGRRRHRPVHQRHRRLPAGELHRLPVLRVGMPVRHSEVQQHDEEGLQVHAVLGPRRAGARAGLHQGVSDRLPEVRDEGRHAGARRRARADSCASIRDFRMPASTIRRRSAARTSSTCCTTSRSRSCTAGCRRIRRFHRPTRSGSVWRSRLRCCSALFAAPVAFFHYIDRRARRSRSRRHERCRDERLPSSDSTRARAAGSARTGARSCETASCCGIRSTRACCTGASPIFFILALLSGLRDLLAVALSLADAAIRRRTDDAAAASVVQSRIRRDLRAAVPELAEADVVDARRPPLDAPRRRPT